MTADDVSPAEVMSTCCLAVASGGYVVALTMVAREASDGFRSIDGLGKPMLVLSLLIVSGFSMWRLVDSCLAAAQPVSIIHHMSALLPPFAVCAMLAAPIWVHF